MTESLQALGPTRRFATLRTIGALVLREMATTYGRTPGGYLWAILEPVGGVALLTIIFAFTFSSPPIGTNFAIFYATGVIPFMFYNDLAQKISQSLAYSRPLLVYPAVTFFDALIARLITNTLSGVLVAFLVFMGIEISFDTQTQPKLSQIALSLSMATMLALGVGTLNCYLFHAFPLWQKVWGILNRPLFIMSCVFFVFDSISKAFQEWLWYNPLVHVIGQMRHGFYSSYHADYVDVIYVFALSLVLFTTGLALLLRYHRDLLSEM
ncbi:ABC transporter permease [Albirhodobacter sp. R86504]|uniref:ABC transporter permease n=1 Tax=Albirhodobacter sp. R86504 TaxID=3093848 RepID=UPI0036707A44